MNGMKWSELRDDDALETQASTTCKARVFLIFSLLIAVACVAGSGFIMSDKFLKDTLANNYAWSGISCFAGTLVVLLAAFVMRAGTVPPTDAY
jgi:hypothetical protein